MSERRVMVVDDNEANRTLVVETLSVEGFEVVEAASGALALEAFPRAPIDVVLMDVRMPGLDGFETLARLRALPGGAEVPVVFFTALRDVDTFDRARAAGAADFLTKPVRPTELLVRVETLMRMHQLGSEVRCQLEEIRRQRDDLLRLHLQKERLSAFLVHDLKNPLASMRLQADLLLRTAGMPADGLESALAVREQCDRLHQLILNLLDISKADEGQLRPVFARMSMRALCAEVVASLGAQAREREVLLEQSCEGDDEIEADHDLLRRTLENLVDNALRHAPAQTAVSLRAVADGDGVSLSVRDRGRGIPPALVERIFDPFVQSESQGASRSGRGLGLAFCRMAVHAHGGTIEVVPSAEGAVFSIWLPRSRGEVTA